MQVYLVGGAVRDQRLGLPAGDRDWVVVGATPADMVAQGFKPLDADFPVFTHPETGEVYALARRETKRGQGYRGFDIDAGPDVTLPEDLQRRDLTINAMAEDADGLLIDPFGGAADLQQGLLRHVSPAFVEDPVRILRAARFAARFSRIGFRVAHGTWVLMKSMVASGEVDALVPERLWYEMDRALGEDHPWKFFEVLQRCGALAVLMPELDAALPLAAAHTGGEGVTVARAGAALAAAVALTPDHGVRLAAFLAALGAPRTAASVCDRLPLPADVRELVLLAGNQAGAMPGPDADGDRLLGYLECVDALRRPRRFAHLMLVCAALGRAVGVEQLQDALAAASAVSATQLQAEGYAGRELGEQLRIARVAAINAIAGDE